MLHISRASQDGIIGPIKNHLTGRLTLAASTTACWIQHAEPDDSGVTGPHWLFRATPESVTPLLPNGLGQRFTKLARALPLDDQDIADYLAHLYGLTDHNELSTRVTHKWTTY